MVTPIEQIRRHANKKLNAQEVKKKLVNAGNYIKLYYNIIFITTPGNLAKKRTMTILFNSQHMFSIHTMKFHNDFDYYIYNIRLTFIYNHIGITCQVC